MHLSIKKIYMKKYSLLLALLFILLSCGKEEVVEEVEKKDFIVSYLIFSDKILKSEKNQFTIIEANSTVNLTYSSSDGKHHFI